MTSAGRWTEVAKDFAPRRLPATVAIGLVLALVNAILTVAIISLIFSDRLADALPVGIGVALVASAALGFVIAISSGFPGIYSGIQDSSAAIIGLSGASIATSLVGPEAVDTVLAMMIATSLVTGAVFILMARFRLGEIARFVPFPVVGGLLAGTGYLILVGSLGILEAGWSLDDVMITDALGLLWPGLVLGGAFLFASLRNWPSKAYLAFLVSGIGGFHVVSQLAGVGKAASLGRGWLLGPFPDGSLWPGFAAQALTDADWAAIAGEAASLITVLLLVPLTLLLYISALEVETQRDLDLNAELRATGWGNLASGAVGGPPGYVYLSDTLVAHRVIGGRRGPALVAPLALLGLVVAGSSVLEFLPQFVIGGLLLFVGINFLVEWLWTMRRRMTRLDYGLMVGIVTTIAIVGFLTGVAVGIAAAVALFVYRYSRIDVVRHLLTAREHHSNIERPLDQQAYLSEVGDAVVVLELQGYVFFGTASHIVDRVKTYKADTDSLRFVIFDFRRVSGLDSTAVALFERIAHLARDSRLTLVFTNLRPSYQAQFSDYLSRYSDVTVERPDLDRGMAWCEDQLLEGLEASAETGLAFPNDITQRLAPYLQPRTLAQGERFMTQGDPSPGIFLITSGTATVLLEDVAGANVRLRTLHEGTVLGEISLYRREPCTATVVADTECEVLHLTPQTFDDLRRDDPGAAADLHEFVALTLAGRVSYANLTIRALRD